MELEEHAYDVVVIGAGGAGLRAAIAAHETGARTAVVCKSLLGKAHTVMAEGGIAAAMANAYPEDNWRGDFPATERGGEKLDHWGTAQLHAQEAPDRVRELEDWGALFDRTPDGLISQRDFGGHRYARLAHVGDRTGLELIRTLQQRTVALGIDVYMESTVTRLLTDDSGIAGAFGYWRESGRFVAWEAPSGVLATGGIGKTYKVTSNSWEYTGDGHSLALQAGATLVNMEFVQFHPTGMVWPPSVRGILVTESVRGDGGVLKNSAGNRFMFDYIPDFFRKETAETEDEADRWYTDKKNNRRPPELLPRDEVARAINSEVKAGRGSPHGGGVLGHPPRPARPPREGPARATNREVKAARAPPPGGVSLATPPRRDADYIRKRLPSMYHQFKELADVDITTEAMEVGPTCHYVMGGVEVDPDTEVARVPGLYAAGEVAGGMHGSNRLGGNSLSDLLVFGRRAGVAAAEHASKTAGARAEVAEDALTEAARAALAPFDRDGGENPYTVQHDLQQTMHDLVGIIRTRAEVEQALDRIAVLRERVANLSVEGHRQYNPGWHLALDLPHMLVVSECIARAALEREESRGGHTRDDFPAADPDWGKINLICALSPDGDVTIRRQPLPTMPGDVAEIFEENA